MQCPTDQTNLVMSERKGVKLHGRQGANAILPLVSDFRMMSERDRAIRLTDMTDTGMAPGQSSSALS
ncbi:hypothetical protein GCM10009751_09370 [Myceligenerans crystallogenes]|uniref:Uncharacterized protein n=1 Tax=Myceligenerans crystallogenes TaxID=316335 RepID=A0ABP4ZLR4_9MICO